VKLFTDLCARKMAAKSAKRIAETVEGGKKDGPFLARQFLPTIEKLDPEKNKTDIVFFDGGSNMQLAGRIIEAIYPRVTVVHAAEHLLALVFSDMGKIPAVKVRPTSLKNPFVYSPLT